MVLKLDENNFFKQDQPCPLLWLITLVTHVDRAVCGS